MIHENENRGKWWLPGKPNNKLSGVLKLIPGEGAKLDLDGIFGNVESPGKQYDLILGELSNNRCQVTLHDCYIEGITFGEYSKTEIFIFNVFEGCQFESLNDIEFKFIYAQLPYITEWENPTCFTIDRNDDYSEITIKYKRSDSLVLFKNSDFCIELTHDQEGPNFSIVQKDVSLKQNSRLRITCLSDYSFNNYTKILFHLLNLFSFIVMKPLYPICVNAICKRNSSYIKIHYPIKIGDQLKPVHPLRMLFTLNDIKEKTQEVFNNWFNKKELLEPILNLYFGILYNSAMYLEHKFLSQIQALESYHRRTKNNADLPIETHNKRISDIIDTCPFEYKKWLSEKLNYSNEPSLRKRVKEILLEQSEIAYKFIENEKSFITEIVDTRNYFTHYDIRLKNKAASGIRLMELNKKIKIILELCLLSELGFEHIFIEKTLPKLERGFNN